MKESSILQNRYHVHFVLQGDSGSPTNCYKDGKWQVAGIVSWGYDCHTPPHVQARVSYFLEWIYSSMQAYEDTSICGFKPRFQRKWIGTEEEAEVQNTPEIKQERNTVVDDEVSK